MRHDRGPGSNQYAAKPRTRYGAGVKVNVPEEYLAHLWDMISDPNATEDSLRLIVDEDSGMISAVLISGGVSPSMLGSLADHPEAHVRRAVSNDVRTPAEALGRMSADPDTYVRCNVAGHPATEPAVLASMGNDSAPAVVYQVATNPHTPVRTLHQISLGRDPVAAIAADSTLTSILEASGHDD